MACMFVCISIFSFKCSDGGVHGEFLVGWCIPGNCISIVMGSGFLLGCWSGFLEGKFRQGNFWLKSVGGSCFSENYIRGHGCFKVIIFGV